MMEPTPPPPKELGQNTIYKTKSKSRSKLKSKAKSKSLRSKKGKKLSSKTTKSNSNKPSSNTSTTPKRTRIRFKSSKSSKSKIKPSKSSKTKTKTKIKSKSKATSKSKTNKKSNKKSTKSLKIRAKTMDDFDFNDLTLNTTFSPSPSSPPSLLKSPPVLQETRSMTSCQNKKPAKKQTPKASMKKQHTKSRSKIFNIFNSPKSEPPPMPSCQKLQETNSCTLPVASSKKNKKRRSLSISRRGRKKKHDKIIHQQQIQAQTGWKGRTRSDATLKLEGDGDNKHNHVRRESKLKSILSNIFPKKSVNKPRKRHSRSISFSLRKKKKDKAKKEKKSKNKDKTKRNSKMSQNMNMKVIRKKTHKNTGHKKHNSCNNINMLDMIENMDWMDKLDEDGIDIESDIDYDKWEFKDDTDYDEQYEQLHHHRGESSFQSEVRKIKQDMMNNMLEKAVLREIEEQDEKSSDSDDNEQEYSESVTEEYKDDLHDQNGLPLNRPSLNPKSSTNMRSFEKRPEYTTYYPPASLIEVFNNITVHPKEKSATTNTTPTAKSGSRSRDKLSAVDALFELAAVNMDYGSYYGHNNNNNYHHGSNNGLTSHHLFGNHYSAPPELFHDHNEEHTEETYETYHSQYHTSSGHSSDKLNSMGINRNDHGHNLLAVEFDNDYELNPTTPTMDVSALSSLPEYDEDECEHDMTMAWE